MQRRDILKQVEIIQAYLQRTCVCVRVSIPADYCVTTGGWGG